MVFLKLNVNVLILGAFFIFLLVESADVYLSKDLQKRELSDYALNIETYEMDANEVFRDINENFKHCLNWYSLVFNPMLNNLFVPSFPPGIFILFSVKSSSCEVDWELFKLFFSIYNFEKTFKTFNSTAATTIYSKEYMYEEFNNKFYTGILMEILSKVNKFSPNHPEFYSLDDEKLKYIYFPIIEFNYNVYTELMKTFFGVFNHLKSIFYLQRISVFDQLNKWNTKTTVSRIERADSENPCKNYNFKITRKIKGGGFHWNLETQIESSTQNIYWVMLDTFNREVFLDIDEISQKNERINDINGKLIPLHPVHIERPSEESQGSLLLSIGSKSLIPIHMRYQSACQNCSYKPVLVSMPAIFLYKNESKEFCAISESRFEFHSEQNVARGASKDEIIINIPVGDTRYINYVFVTTLLAIALVTITTGISIIKY